MTLSEIILWLGPREINPYDLDMISDYVLRVNKSGIRSLCHNIVVFHKTDL